mmetsp:Transcript_2577/g.3513  ORF Transcript_2577/g.3513 Transcript_2577/m.3513 type:complete len:114 (-) Transcript_2577:450-791(-)
MHNNEKTQREERRRTNMTMMILDWRGTANKFWIPTCAPCYRKESSRSILCHTSPTSLHPNRSLIEAVDEYYEKPSAFCYRIGLWDVSQITDSSHLFDARSNETLERFNEDPSK